MAANRPEGLIDAPYGFSASYTGGQSSARDDDDKPSAAGAFVRGVGRAAAPTAVGLVTGVGTTIAATPALTPVGGLAAGVGTGMAAGYATGAAQQKLFEKYPRLAAALGQSPEQIQADLEAHPTAALVGEFAPGFAAFRPSVSAFPLRSLAGKSEAAAQAIKAARVQATIGAGIGATTDVVGQKLVEGRDELDLQRLALATTAGALQQKPTKYVGEPLTRLARAPIPQSVLDRYDARMGVPPPGSRPTPNALPPGDTSNQNIRRGQNYDLLPDELEAARQDPVALQRLRELRARMGVSEAAPGVIPDGAMARPEDTATGDLFAETNATDMATNRFTPKGVFAMLRGFGAQDSLNTLKLAKQLSDMFMVGDDGASATAHIDKELTKHTNTLGKLQDQFSDGILDEAAYKKKAAAPQTEIKRLNAAKQTIDAYRTEMAQAREADGVVTQGRAAERETARQGVIESADRARSSADVRGQILDRVMADPDTQNVGNRFRAALRAAGIRDLDVLPEEAARIAKFEELRGTFDAPFELTGSPAEDVGIVRRGEPEPQADRRAPLPEPNENQGELFTPSGNPTRQAMGTTAAQLRNPANFRLELSPSRGGRMTPEPVETPAAPERNPAQGRLFRNDGQPTQQAMRNTENAVTRSRSSAQPAPADDGFRLTSPTPDDFPARGDTRAPAPVVERNPAQGEMFTKRGEPTKQAMGESKQQLVNEANSLLKTLKGKAALNIMDRAVNSFMRNEIDMPTVRQVHELLKANKRAQAEKLLKPRGDEPPPDITPPPPPPPPAAPVDAAPAGTPARTPRGRPKSPKAQAPAEDVAGARPTLTIARDGIEGVEIPFDRVPNGNDAFQYVLGKTEADGGEAVFRRRADERGTYGGWRVETDANKLRPATPRDDGAPAPRAPAPQALIDGLRGAVNDLFGADIISKDAYDFLNDKLDSGDVDVVRSTVQRHFDLAKQQGRKIPTRQPDPEAQQASDAVAARRKALEDEERARKKAEEDDDADVVDTPPEPTRSRILRELRAGSRSGASASDTISRIARKYAGTPKDVSDDSPAGEMVDPDAPAYQETSIQAKPGVNARRLAKLMGPQLYGDMANMGQINIKEVLQNSFDAIRTALRTKQIQRGRIEIKAYGHDISMVDNGVGMTPETLGTKFLEIAGTGKEGAENSGGFGIAKMLFLYGNEDLRVITMRDGRVAELKTSGQELFDALENPSVAPDIVVRSPTSADRTMFPDGHGTSITMNLPKKFMDVAKGEERDVRGVYSPYEVDSLRRSPLFHDVDVTFNGVDVAIGSKFDVAKYTQFAKIKFGWGNADIYIAPDKHGWDDNVHVLSNGLHQFSEMAKTKQGWRGERLPFEFFVDLHPKVKPDEPGYPFNLNRQGLTNEAQVEYNKVMNYIKAMYAYEGLSSDAENFGDIAYLDPDTGETSERFKLEPTVPPAPSEFRGFSPTDKVSVVDGRLLVNGKEKPELTPEQLESGLPSSKDLKVDSGMIDPTRVMIHDNLNIVDDKTDVATSIIDHMRNRFGKTRYDDFQATVGETFFELRRMVSDILQYPDLMKEGIGLSYDKQYRGVSTRIPFSGSFINPLLAESAVPREAAYGLIGTMVHELAHHKVRSHDSDFPAEMQRISYKLLANSDFAELQNNFANLLTARYSDILTEGHKLFAEDSSANTSSNSGYRLEPRGKRFKDSSEAVGPEGSGDRTAFGDAEGTRARGGSESVFERTSNGRGPSAAGGAGRRPPGSTPSQAGGSRPPRNPGSQRLTVDPTPENRRRAMTDPATMETTASDWWVNLKGTGRRTVLKLMDQSWLADKYHGDIPQLPRFNDMLLSKRSLAGSLQQQAARVHSSWKSLSPDESSAVNDLLLDASRAKVDLTQADGEGPLFDRYYAMSREAQNVYDSVRGIYDQQFNLAKETIKRFIDDDESMTADEKTAAIKELDTRFRRSDGYFPFERFGDFIAIAESPEYTALRKESEALEARMEVSRSPEKQKEAAKQLREVQKEMKKLADAGERSVIAHETEAEMLRTVEELEGQGYSVRQKLAHEFDANTDGVSDTFMRKVNSSLDSMASKNPDDAKGILGMKSMLNQMYLSMMPAGSALKRQLQRKNVAGYSQDAQRVFAATTTRNANYLAELRHGHETRKLLNDIGQTVRDKPIPVQEVYQQLRKNYNALQDQSQAPVLDFLKNTSYVYMLGASPSFTVMHLMQTPLIGAPILAGRHSPLKILPELTRAGQDVIERYEQGLETGDDMSFGKNIGEREMLRYMRDRTVFDNTEVREFMATGKGSGFAREAGRTILHYATLVPHHTERFNRLTMALTAYRLAMADNKLPLISQAEFDQYVADHPQSQLTKKQLTAAKYAEKAVQDTNVNYSEENAAYFMKKGGPGAMRPIFTRLTVQFLKYQYGMFKILAQNAGKLKDPGERAVAARTLAGIFATHATMTGLMGAPFAGAVMLTFNLLQKMFGDPNDPVDAETRFRNQLADSFGPEAGDVLARGALRLPGVRDVLPVDITGRVGLGDLLVGSNRGASSEIDKANTLAYLASVIGGPAISLVGNMADGFKQLSDGEFQKGLEAFLPKVVRDVSKGLRYMETGVTTAGNKPVLEAEDLSAGDVAAQLVGFQSQRVESAFAQRGAFQRVQTSLQKRRSKLLRAYARAQKSGDVAAIAQARRNISEYNELQRSKKNFSEIISPRSMMRTDRQRQMDLLRLQNGVSPMPREMGLMENYADFAYDEDEEE